MCIPKLAPGSVSMPRCPESHNKERLVLKTKRAEHTQARIMSAFRLYTEGLLTTLTHFLVFIFTVGKFEYCSSTVTYMRMHENSSVCVFVCGSVMTPHSWHFRDGGVLSLSSIPSPSSIWLLSFYTCFFFIPQLSFTDSTKPSASFF